MNIKKQILKIGKEREKMCVKERSAKRKRETIRA